tara:strand:+ start:1750 stop:2448 length:699 start_codon:yes stop_codon:yes gene_type:complete
MENDRYKCSVDSYFDPKAASVSIRRNGIYFNTSCTQMAGLHNFSTVSAERDHLEYNWSSTLFIRGSNEKPSCENFSFSSDQRRRKKAGPLYLSCKRLISQFSCLRKLAEGKRENARIPVKYDETTKEVIIPIVPQFEHFKNDPKDLPKAPGIYSYHQGNECVYYGRGGSLFDRAQDDIRKSWQFDQIRYTFIPFEEKRIFWENHFLEKYKSKNGCLPRYNLISGSSKYQEAA